MKEKDFWSYLKDIIGAKWVAVRIENGISQGVPDVSFSSRGVHGWIELKYLKAWPKRPDTIVKIPHYTPAQKLFLRQHGSYGRNCFLFLRVGDDFLLFDDAAAQEVGAWTKFDLISSSLAHWEKEVDPAELLLLICERTGSGYARRALLKSHKESLRATELEQKILAERKAEERALELEAGARGISVSTLRAEKRANG